jgi:ribonuclease P protein component
MRRRADFTAAVRTGRRASSPSVVLHVVRRPEADDPARIGLIVSKGVGGSVVRHQVARRIRGACAGLLSELSPGDLLVVRALPDAARATSAQLAVDLQQALARLAGRRPSPGAAA